MQTATFLLESRSDPICYQVGIDETAYIQFVSSPASMIFGTTSGSMKVTVSNAGAMVYTPGPLLVWGDPGRSPVGTRNVQRRTGGEIMFVGSGTAVATVTLLIRAETRYIKFGGWGDPWGDGTMCLYSAANQWTYNPKPTLDGFNVVGSSLAGMSGRLTDPLFTTVEGQVTIGSERGGGPGSIQLKTGSQYIALWNGPCKILMTSPNGALWSITPGAGGALTPAPG